MPGVDKIQPDVRRLQCIPRRDKEISIDPEISRRAGGGGLLAHAVAQGDWTYWGLVVKQRVHWVA